MTWYPDDDPDLDEWTRWRMMRSAVTQRRDVSYWLWHHAVAGNHDALDSTT